LLALAVASQRTVSYTRELRERLMFIAFVLAMAAILQQALLREYGTDWAHKQNSF
jgi:hypothetical protein